MNVLRKLPNRPWERVEVDNTLEALQEQVGGYIETVTFRADACVLCNEEGAIHHLPYNTTICRVDFLGPVLIVGVKGEEFTDLTETQEEDLRATGAIRDDWEAGA